MEKKPAQVYVVLVQKVALQLIDPVLELVVEFSGRFGVENGLAVVKGLEAKEEMLVICTLERARTRAGSVKEMVANFGIASQGKEGRKV
jgi:hypothetical protein